MRSQNRDVLKMRFYLNMMDGIIHDLENEKEECRIADIQNSGCGVGFQHAETALTAGFIPCQYCMATQPDS